jgi:hypothetical protein
MPQTDELLIRFTCEEAAALNLMQCLTSFAASAGYPLVLHRLARSAATQQTCLYLRLRQPCGIAQSALRTLTALWQRACPAARSVKLSRLENVFDAPGHSQQESPVFHYVVEMDPDRGWMPELARWYDTEHMPGLAAVPGCIRAQRFYNHDDGPLSLACYDLVTQETLGSPPWLAVRGTPWSDVVRPHFTNTRRTMFKVLG